MKSSRLDACSPNVIRLLQQMTREEKIGQVLCPDVCVLKNEPDKIVEMVQRNHLGSLFVFGWSRDEVSRLTAKLDRLTRTPVLIASDLEHGAGPAITDATEYPFFMAVGAADDVGLAEAMGQATSREGAAAGIQWTYSPVIDINLNRNNPVVNVRAFSDDAERVARLASAYIRGIQHDSRMAATAKHFPGDGVDDRDQHLCTSVNSLTRKDWEKTFGHVWSRAINDGVMSIMVGHIALPFIDDDPKYIGGVPATLSRKIQIDFLRGELGFKGLIVSDAIPMVGISTHCKRNDIALRNIHAGSDVVLFSIADRDAAALKAAAERGELSDAQLDEAAAGMLMLKEQLGSLEKRRTFPEITDAELAGHREASLAIAQKSATLVRNAHDLLPMRHLRPGSRVLTVTMQYDSGSGLGQDQGERYREMPVIDEELRRRGFVVEHAHNSTKEMRENKYDAVFLNVKIIPHCFGNTVRMVGPIAWHFWDSLNAETDNLVVTSFGSPYIARDLSFAASMVLMHSYGEESQRAAVRVWLGEEPISTTNCPVSLD
jgi:beta-N-acetylhexosaminidase